MAITDKIKYKANEKTTLFFALFCVKSGGSYFTNILLNLYKNPSKHNYPILQMMTLRIGEVIVAYQTAKVQFDLMSVLD